MRSFLYVPGDQPEKLRKAMGSGADALILDLEDAVAVNQKQQARKTLTAFLNELGVESAAQADPSGHLPSVWVRINQGDDGLDDIAAVTRAAGSRLAGIYVPKTETLAQLSEVDRSLSIAELGSGLPANAIQVCALLETPQSIFDARLLAFGPRVMRLAIGEADLRASLGTELTPDDEREHLLARQMLVLASAAAGLEPPVGPVFTDFRDVDALRRSTVALKRMGFRGRAAIHPAQVPIINDVFTPTAAEIERAERLIQRFDLSIGSGHGVCVDDDGRMIDEAVVRSARRILGTT
jgi:citrate lyase subunit beta / citryl-CoA lyase